MEFPLNSLGAFMAGFGITSLICSWLQIYVLGWYEKKWSPGFNLSLDTIGTIVLMLPVATFGFLLGAYLVNTPFDPWRRSLLGAVVFAVLFFFAARLSLHVSSDTLSGIIVWGTLILGSAGVGAWARLTARAAA